jgi:hypothetical protein
LAARARSFSLLKMEENKEEEVAGLDEELEVGGREDERALGERGPGSCSVAYNSASHLPNATCFLSSRCPSPLQDDVITLVSKNKERFEVSRRAALLSTFIKTTLDGGACSFA